MYACATRMATDSTGSLEKRQYLADFNDFNDFNTSEERDKMESMFALFVALFALAQEPRLPGPPPPGLDGTPSGALVRRSIDAHGGWDVWRSRENVQYRLTTAEFGLGGARLPPRRERHQILLRGPVRVRLELDPEQVVILAEAKVAIERGGKRVADPALLREAARSATSAYRLFRLPFSLADPGVSLKLVAGNASRVRATWPGTLESEEGDWVEVTFSKAGQLDTVFYSERGPQGEAFFVAELHYGQWASGILKEEHRMIYASDRVGHPLRRLAEALLEEVRFDQALLPEFFEISLPTESRP